MRITLAELSNPEDQEKIRNFFRIFGFIVITGVLSRSELRAWRREFSSLYTDYFKKPMWKIIARLRSSMVPAFADRSDLLLSWLNSERILNIPKILIGEHFSYWGSDGSLFFTGSGWHRDLFTQARPLKMNVYLQRTSTYNGALRLIPGSQMVGDVYASALGLACAWPGKSTLGGMSESGILMQNPHPAKLGIIRFFRGLRKKLIEIPHHVVTARAGDIIVFDERLVHSVNAPLVPRIRKLVTFLFFSSARDLAPDAPELQNGFTRETMDKELADLKAIECRMYSTKAYGEKLKKGHYPNIESHLLPEPDVGASEQAAGYGGYTQGFDANVADFLTRNYRKKLW